MADADDWITPAVPKPAVADDWTSAPPRSRIQVTPRSGEPLKPATTDLAPGMVESGLHGLRSGLTANFGDELSGLQAASPGWAPPGFGHLMALGRLAHEYYNGPGEATKAYETERNRVRAENRLSQETNPGSYLAGNIVGAVATPGSAALTGATMPARMARSALTGATYGALSGVGEGETPEDRATRGLTGASIGTAAGALGPPVLRGIEGAVNLGRGVVDKFTAPFRGLRDPEAEAARRIAITQAKDLKTRGTPSLSPEEEAIAQKYGLPLNELDRSGEATRALARSAANVSPEARQTLNQVVQPRFEAQSERAADVVQNLVRTPANATVTREALDTAARTERAPYYNKAYRDGANGIWDGELSQIANSPLMKPIMVDAANSLQTKRLVGRGAEPLSPTGTPTLAYWDQVKRTLDSRINVLKRAGENEAVADLSAIRSHIVDKMDRATTDPKTGISSYETARGVAATLFKATDAVEAGEKFLTQRMHNPDVRAAVARMMPEERTLFAEGYASALYRKITESKDKRSILGNLATSLAERERMEIALGPRRAKEFETYLRLEGLMDMSKNAIQGNSTTARQMIEAGMASSAGYGYSTGDTSITGLLTAALTGGGLRKTYGFKGVQSALSTKTARGVAEETAKLLTTGKPAQIAAAAARIARSNSMVQSMRSFDAALAKTSASHPPNFGALQGTVPARTEDQQPQ